MTRRHKALAVLLLVLAASTLGAGIAMVIVAIQGRAPEPWERWLYAAYLLLTAGILVGQSLDLRNRARQSA